MHSQLSSSIAVVTCINVSINYSAVSKDSFSLYCCVKLSVLFSGYAMSSSLLIVFAVKTQVTYGLWLYTTIFRVLQDIRQCGLRDVSDLCLSSI